MTWISSLRRLSVLGLLVAGAMSLPVQGAFATTFAEMSVEQFTDASTYIVKGVVQSKPTTALEGEHVYTYTTIQVDEVLKGPDSPETLTLRERGGTFQGVKTRMHGQTVYSDGENVFVFLHKTPQGNLVTLSSFLGKHTIRRAPGERRSYLRTWQASDATRTYDHRFIPHPPADQLVYLDAFEDRVKDQLQVGWSGERIQGFTVENLETINTPERRLR